MVKPQDTFSQSEFRLVEMKEKPTDQAFKIQQPSNYSPPSEPAKPQAEQNEMYELAKD